VQGFKTGKTTLNAFEMEELGDVSGKTLLHLQCHFGLDSLSWARLGARVVGVDFSDRAIELASNLSDELDLQAEFVCSDIYELPSVLKGEFDIVYTSNGVLPWLPDLKRWGEVIAHFLKPGGIFYIAEFHPFAYVFNDAEDMTDLQVHYPYFHSPEPLEFEVRGTYAAPQAAVTQKLQYEWVHSMGDIINALVTAGLHIEFLHEYPFCTYAMFPPLMERGKDGLWRLREKESSVPLTFTIKARK
jgi:SAM-dependent methyltransferase